MVKSTKVTMISTTLQKVIKLQQKLTEKSVVKTTRKKNKTSNTKYNKYYGKYYRLLFVHDNTRSQDEIDIQYEAAILRIHHNRLNHFLFF